MGSCSIKQAQLEISNNDENKIESTGHQSKLELPKYPKESNRLTLNQHVDQQRGIQKTTNKFDQWSKKHDLVLFKELVLFREEMWRQFSDI